jgi:hypothetical protein
MGFVAANLANNLQMAHRFLIFMLSLCHKKHEL